MSKIRRRKKSKTRSERVAKQREGRGTISHSWQDVLRTHVRYAMSRYCDNPLFFGGKKKPMDISVIYEDGTENEVEVEICCSSCALDSYGWSQAQYDDVLAKVRGAAPILVPESVRSPKDFIKHIKTHGSVAK